MMLMANTIVNKMQQKDQSALSDYLHSSFSDTVGSCTTRHDTTRIISMRMPVVWMPSLERDEYNVDEDSSDEVAYSMDDSK